MGRCESYRCGDVVKFQILATGLARCVRCALACLDEKGLLAAAVKASAQEVLEALKDGAEIDSVSDAEGGRTALMVCLQ